MTLALVFLVPKAQFQVSQASVLGTLLERHQCNIKAVESTRRRRACYYHYKKSNSSVLLCSSFILITFHLSNFVKYFPSGCFILLFYFMKKVHEEGHLNSHRTFLSLFQRCAYKYSAAGFLGEITLIYGARRSLWCKYSHRGWSQDTDRMSPAWKLRCVRCSPGPGEWLHPPHWGSSLDYEPSENLPISAGPEGHATILFMVTYWALFFQDSTDPRKYDWVSRSQPHPGGWRDAHHGE